MYWEYTEYTSDSGNETPDGNNERGCYFRELKKHNSYILRTESYNGSFIKHKKGAVKLSAYLIDQGLYVKPQKFTLDNAKKSSTEVTTAKKRKTQSYEVIFLIKNCR